MELTTRYNPTDVEDKIYAFWQALDLFRANNKSKKKPFTIVIPPPNVTGILHMGHALNNTIQDIITRYKRMQGFEVLWLPGTDHAGIATQNVVERRLQQEGINRKELGRDKFLEKVWEWKKLYGDTIIMQLKKMGCSCDWSRLRFTMDEGLSKAVTEAFIKLYNDKLIYRGVYVINWCPRCQTALSDEEVIHRDIEGSLYYIRYPLKKIQNPKSKILNKSQIPNPKSQNYIVVATTRPETMLGDIAVAVNEKDKRFKDFVGKTVILPLIERQIPIIKDSYVDPKFGTGAVKVTPAHDANDYMMAMRHDLDYCLVMNPDGTMNEMAGEYQGMDRFEAREAILEDLKERKLLEKVTKHDMSVGHCYRCHTVIEPYLSSQWFVSMKPLTKDGIKEVKLTKSIKFHPQRWTKVYLNWIENLRDWCISRQIWWGHRIPVYYCKNCYQETKILKSKIKMQNSKIEKGIIVSKTKPESCPTCGLTEIHQDEDVLDTWFSSWLWPFSTLGWPDETDDLKYFYPTNTLVTASEILFFWVARMIIAGLYFKKDIPFKDVYIHGTVRDDTGKKMSKSLGNIIDPLEIINEFGADALRFSIISITATGQDVYLSKEKFHLGRNFANKIWNASRFILMNLTQDNIKVDLCVLFKSTKLSLLDKWILSRFYSTLDYVTKCLDEYSFNEAANSIYEFFWHDFCDWYIEMAKLSLTQKTTQIILYKILEKSLRMLHPFIPFITEEIWQKLPHQDNSIMVQNWPHLQKEMISKDIDKKMQHVIDVVTSIRNMRQEMSIQPKTKLNVNISIDEKGIVDTINENISYIKQLADLDNIIIGKSLDKPKNSVTVVLKNIQIYICLEGVVDIEKERQRLSQEAHRLKIDRERILKLLKNKEFIKKAPETVIENEKNRLIDLDLNFKKIEDLLKSFK